jgi:NAD(P)-dependent dehydrogenase (short-subunit alcohol dehydrogenase family)
MTIRFSSDNLDLFARSSGDTNPLHLSAAYARRTPFGRPVVYGVLGALAVMARLAVPVGKRASRINLAFVRPMFPETDYRIEGNSLYDGSEELLKVDVEFEPGSPAAAAIEARDFRDRAASLAEADLAPGFERSGAYGPHPSAAEALWQRLGIDPEQWGSLPLAALLWSSYLAGMELPGERALYSRLSMRFDPRGGGAGPLDWNARLVSGNRLNVIRAEFALHIGGERAATGEIGAWLRPLPVKPDDSAFSRSDELSGKTALITGASRGLGASIARSLAFRGAKILANFHKSLTEAERLRDGLPEDSIHLLQADAADVNAWRAVREKHRSIDFLILNACPPVSAIRAEPETAARISDYVSQAFALTAVPLAVFAADVRQATVLISSEYAESYPEEFPHYVAVKAAAEGMLRSVARQHPNPGYLIVRPSKLLTDMTNTPYGTAGALAPEKVAVRLAGWLAQPVAGGTVEILGL